MIPRGVVALGLVGALACAGVAEADCAWVLWRSTSTWTCTSTKCTEKRSYDVLAAYATSAECYAAVRAGVIWDGLCLPDTVDPRAPKSH